MSKDRSIEGETEKAIRFYNLIREISDDIYELPVDKKILEQMGDLLGVVCIVIRDNGAERFGSTVIDLPRYLEFLEGEYERMSLLNNISLTTGENDIYDISKMISDKTEEREFGKGES